MFPGGVNPRQMEQMMRMMGIKQETVPASEVVIRSDGRDIVIKNPQVVKVIMKGQAQSFQVSGDVEERAAEVEISADDVKTVMEQAGVSEDEAIAAIKSANGDLAGAIMNLKS